MVPNQQNVCLATSTDLVTSTAMIDSKSKSQGPQNALQYPGRQREDRWIGKQQVGRQEGKEHGAQEGS
jgi:hypothetical protein